MPAEGTERLIELLEKSLIVQLIRWGLGRETSR